MPRHWTPPPNWPPPPTPGWAPPPGWQPDPSWGPPPDGWNFYPEVKGWAAQHALLIVVLAVPMAIAYQHSGRLIEIFGPAHLPVLLSFTSAYLVANS